MRERQQGDENESNRVGRRSYATVGLCPLPHSGRLRISYFQNISHCVCCFQTSREIPHTRVIPQRPFSAVLLFRFCNQAMWVQISTLACELGKSPNLSMFHLPHLEHGDCDDGDAEDDDDDDVGDIVYILGLF